MQDYITYIIAKCGDAAGSYLQPCLKQAVYACLTTTDGVEFFGANWMTAADVTVCPRVVANSKTGEDYHLCSDICNQEFHAERAAIDACVNSGHSPAGSTVRVVGHTYCCDGCIAAMTSNGIAYAIVLDSGKEYRF